MTLKQILLFDINRILNWDLDHLLQWDVGRALQSDVTKWRIPSILLRALAGWLVASILLAMIVTTATQRGWHVSDWMPLAVTGASILAFTLPWRSRS
ncbi:MAG TPA: hypothetical protein VM791_04565 [Vicinamibacterales bacterium]|jgi:hypothetical protein|nr:hypothetical protein [Vicinamibacterales bacterium]